MDTVCENKIKVNHGLNVRRIRTANQIKQESFAVMLGVTQQMVSKYENSEVLDEETLNKCAKALEIPVEVLKYMPADESATTQIFTDALKNNTDTNNQNYTASQIRENNVTNNYTGSPEVMEALREAIRLLKSEIRSLKEENKKLRQETEAGKKEK